MKRIVFCKWCAKKFEAANWKQEFCSKRCRQDYDNYTVRLVSYGIDCGIPEKFDREKAKATNKRQARILREAKKIGLSYGKYMAWKSMPPGKRERFLEVNREV